MSKDLWIMEHEQVFEDLAAEYIDSSEARRRLIALGFDNHEIDDQLAQHYLEYA